MNCIPTWIENFLLKTHQMRFPRFQYENYDMKVSENASKQLVATKAFVKIRF